MERLDQLVKFEIDFAVMSELLSEGLGEEYWSAWCGSGEETMQYGRETEAMGSP